MIRTASLGMPRIGKNLQVQREITNYLSNPKKSTLDLILEAGKEIKMENWRIQKLHNVDIIPSNDFSIGDHVLDASCLLGNIHRRYFWEGGQVSLEIYLLMMLGDQKDKFDIQRSELKQWFDTKYFYYAPEVSDAEFCYSDTKLILEYIEAKNQNINSRPVVLGPVTYIMLSKARKPNYQELLNEILAVYEELFTNMKRININSIQIDEHFFCFDIPSELLNAIRQFYDKLRVCIPNFHIALVCSYGSISKNLDLLTKLPINEIHFDVFHNLDKIDRYIEKFSTNVNFSLGIVNAGNIWINDLSKSISIIQKYADKVGTQRIILAPSSSLFTLPYSSKLEDWDDAQLGASVAFAEEKLNELHILKNAINHGIASQVDIIEANKELISYLCKRFNKAQLLEIKEKITKKDKGKSLTSALKTILPTMLVDVQVEKSKGTIDGCLSFQNAADLDVISSVNSQDSYIKDASAGIIFLKSHIQISGIDACKPYILLNCPSVERWLNLESAIDQASVFPNMPFKLNLLGFISFINSSFYYYEATESDMITTSFTFYSNMLNHAINYIKGKAYTNVKIIQFDEHLILTNLSQDFNYQLPHIMKLKSYLDKIFDTIPENIYSAIYIHSAKFYNVIEDLARINFDSMFIECTSTFNDALENFVSYKYSGSVGIGVVKLQENKILLKEDIFAQIKNTNMVIDEKDLIIIPDNKLEYGRFSAENIKKQIKNLLDAREAYVRYLEKIKID